VKFDGSPSHTGTENKIRNLLEVRMFGIGVPQLILILVIVVLIFGVGKLPELGSALGRGIKNFKRGVDDKDET